MRRIAAVLMILAAALAVVVVRPTSTAGAAPAKVLLAGAVNVSSSPVLVPPAFGYATATVACPAGQDITGGGYTITPDPAGSAVVQVIYSRVTTSPPGWEVRALNETGSAFFIAANAVCHPTT